MTESNVVKFTGGVPATSDDLIKSLQNVQSTMVTSTGGLPFFRLLKTGHYAYGVENLEPEEDSEWAIHPASLMHGYACWGDGELLDERMVPANQAKPARSELPEYGQPWSDQVALMLQCLNGEDTGVQVLYKGTSLGLRNAVKDLIGKMITQIKADPDNVVPVIELEVDSYQHKSYGEIFTPQFNLLRWISWAGESADTSDESDANNPSDADATADKTSDETEPAPTRRRRGKATKADDETEPTKNRRRRRK